MGSGLETWSKAAVSLYGASEDREQNLQRRLLKGRRNYRQSLQGFFGYSEEEERKLRKQSLRLRIVTGTVKEA